MPWQQSWRDEAACLTRPWSWWLAEPGPEASMATDICWHECPVRAQCLDASMAEEGWGDRMGIRGGVNAFVRRQVQYGHREMPGTYEQVLHPTTLSQKHSA